jgi:hypothetical protein
MGYVVHSDAPGARNGNALFSYSGGTGIDMTKSAPGHITLNLCFCIRLDLWVTVCILVCPGREMSTLYVLCSGGTSGR